MPEKRRVRGGPGARPDLVVLVGLGASSTLLASALPVLSDRLARRGIRTSPADGVPPVGVVPLLVAPAVGAQVPADPSDAWAFCSMQLDDVARVITASDAQRARVVFCPERQDRLFERAYRAAVADGFAGTIADRFPRLAEPLIDYRTVVAGLQDLAGVSSVQVFPLELLAAGHIAYVDALLGALGCEPPVDLSPLAHWTVPREYGPRGTKIALAMAPHLDTDDERERVRDYVLSAFSVPVGAAAPLLENEVRAQVLTAHRAVNRAFFAECAPEYAANSYNGRAGLQALGATLTPSSVPEPGRTPIPVEAGLPGLAARVRRRLPSLSSVPGFGRRSR